MTKNIFLKILYCLFFISTIVFILALLYDTPFFYKYLENEKLLSHINDIKLSFAVFWATTWSLILYSNFDKLDINKSKLNYYKNNYINYLILSSVLTLTFFVLNKIMLKVDIFNVFIFFYFLFLTPILHILILSVNKDKDSFFSRNIFLIALIILSFVPFFLMVDYKQTAEKLSIYVYYLLILWVISSIVEQPKQKNEKL